MNPENNFNNMQNSSEISNNQSMINNSMQMNNSNMNYQQEPTNYSNNVQPVKKNGKLWIIIIAVLAIVVVGVIIFIFSRNNNEYEGELSEYVVDIVDGVPIPKGFVASSASGENKQKNGLVIYEGTEPVTNENIEDSKRTRNQFVWVPVESFNDFVRKAYQVTTSDNLTYNQVITNKLTDETYTYGEIELDSSNMPVDNQNTNYLSEETINEAKRLYESVKKYGGFYVARYEAGTLFNSTTESNNDVYFQLEKYPISYAYWSVENSQNNVGAIEISRNIYSNSNENYGATSTLIYGVQWDTTIEWMKKSGNIDLSDSTLYGNYGNSSLTNFNLNAKYNYSYFDYNIAQNNHDNTITTLSQQDTKNDSDIWVLTTGASEDTKVNNIYDMAGNIHEHTMEYSSDGRQIVGTTRGGIYYDNGKYNSITNRYGNNYQAGFRIALYIKY